MIKEKYLFNATMVLVFFIPTTIFYIFNTSSQSVGLVISIVLLLPFIMKKINFLDFNYRELLLYSFSISYIMLAMLFNGSLNNDYNIMKLFISLLIILTMIITAKLLAIYIKDKEINSFLKIVFYILIGIALAISLRNILFDINLNDYNNKHMFIFREPSHFALLFTPLLIYNFFQAHLKTRLAYIIIGLLFGILIKSLLLIVGVFFMLLIFLFKYKSMLFILMAILVLVTSLNTLLPDYFLDRIILNSESNNLSVLVFLNGWERILLNLNSSNFFGIGFQQLGFIGENGTFMEKIELMADKQLNLYDGSFLASKIISELGLLGLLYLSIYFLYLFKALKYFHTKKEKNHQLIFAYSFICSFFIELFFRGIGYFSFTVFMFFTSLFLIHNIENKDTNAIGM